MSGGFCGGSLATHVLASGRVLKHTTDAHLPALDAYSALDPTLAVAPRQAHIRGQLSVIAHRHDSVSGSDRLIHHCTTPVRSSDATNPPFRSVIGRQSRRSAVSAIRLEWLKPSKNVTLYLYHAHPLPPSATWHSPQTPAPKRCSVKVKTRIFKPL